MAASADILGVRSAMAQVEQARLGPRAAQLADGDVRQLAAELCWADGFLTAVAIGPNDLSPADWIPLMYGLEFGDTYEDEDLHPVAVATINFVLLLTQLRSDPLAYQPVFYGDTNRGPLAIEWAHGFLSGIETSWEQWLPLLDSADGRAKLAPILALLQDSSGCFYMRAPDIAERLGKTPEQVTDEAAEYVGDAVRNAYAWWNKRRPNPLLTDPWRNPVRRREDKVGRNEPCPCGSGRKSKKCCCG